MKEEYHNREWLTDKGDQATSTVVSFAGVTKWHDDQEPFYMLEISSCHDKVRLHRTPDQTENDWIKQMETLHAHIERYLDFLKSNS